MEHEPNPDNPFTDLRLVSGALCLDLNNTVDHRAGEQSNDRLTSAGALVWWGNRAGIIGPDRVRELLEALQANEEKEEVHRRAIALREAIFRVFTAVAGRQEPRPEDLDVVNRELARGLSHRRVVRDGNSFRFAWDEPGRAEEVLWPVALSAAELLAGPNLARVGRCAGTDCDWLFVDASRNRSRRWCDMKECGNRAKLRRYYRRQRKGE